MMALRRPVLIGLAFGAGAVHLSVVGVLLMLHQRWIIIDVLSLGQATLLLLAGGAGAMAARDDGMNRLLAGLLSGLAAAAPVAALAAIIGALSLQSIFIALSHDLYE